MFEMNCLGALWRAKNRPIVDLKPSMKWDSISGTHTKKTEQKLPNAVAIYLQMKKLPVAETTSSSSTIPMLSFLQNPEQYYLFPEHR